MAVPAGPGHKMWAVQMAVAVVVVLGLLSVAPQPSTALSLKNPLHGAVQMLNENATPSLGLLLSSDGAEMTLNASGLFVPNPDVPFIDFSGRRFHIGKIKGVDVIYAKSGRLSINVALTVQLLVDIFNVRGIVQFGNAGSLDDSLSIGDVVVPSYVAHTGAFTWKKFGSNDGELRFGEYNSPNKGRNMLGSIKYDELTLYSHDQKEQSAFWLPVDSKWLKIASQLQDLNLQKCLNATNCLPNTPQVVLGSRACSADINVENAAYAEFLLRTFNVSTLDTSIAVVAAASFSNGIPCAVFRGISDSFGGRNPYRSFGSLGSINALKVAAEFMGLVKSQQVLSYE